MPPKIAKLAGLGAFAACAGLGALYGALVYITRPVSRGGIDTINAAVAWISLAGVILALVAVHIVIGKQLLALARGRDIKHPL